MKPTQPVSTILAAAALALLLTSCAKEEAHSGLEPEPERGDSASSPRVVATPEVQRKVTDDSNQNRIGGILDEERLVFFEFDKSVVRVEYLPRVNAHTDFLVVNRNKTIILEGHADERGSNEYNLALGLRRAQAVNETMVAGGVFADQIEMISYGEERPLALGSTEAAWAQNRRVRIVYSDE